MACSHRKRYVLVTIHYNPRRKDGGTLMDSFMDVYVCPSCNKASIAHYNMLSHTQYEWRPIYFLNKMKMQQEKYQQMIDREVRAQVASCYDIMLRNLGRIERCPDKCADKLCEYCALGVGFALDELKRTVGKSK